MTGKQVLAFGKSEKLEFINIGIFAASLGGRKGRRHIGRFTPDRERSHVCSDTPHTDNFGHKIIFVKRENQGDHFSKCRCTGLSCPPGQLAPGGEDTFGLLAPQGAEFSKVSSPPPWVSCPRTVFKIKFVFFDNNFSDK